MPTITIRRLLYLVLTMGVVALTLFRSPPPAKAATLSYPSKLAAVKGYNEDVYMLNGDGAIYESYWDGSSWHGAYAITPPHTALRTGGLAAVKKWGNEDVYFTGTDGEIWELYWTGSSWGGPLPITHTGLQFRDIAAVAGYNEDVYAVDYYGAVWEMSWDGSTWNGPWLIIGAETDRSYFYGDSVAVTMNPTRNGLHEDVYESRSDRSIWSRIWTGSSWSGTFPITSPGVFDGYQLAAVHGVNEDLYYLQYPQMLRQLYYDGAWHVITILPSGFTNPSSGVAAVLGNNEDVYYVGVDGHVYETYWTGIWNTPLLIA